LPHHSAASATFTAPPTACFASAPTPLRLGLLYRDAFDLADHVRPALARLVDRTGETAAFYVREGDQRVCLYRHHSPRLIRHHVEEGSALPLDRGAAGRVLTAYTGKTDPLHDELRSRGWYLSLGERDPEVAAIAAPVFGRGRAFLGALGVVGPRSRFEAEDHEGLAAIITGEAALLSRGIGA
jgi:DNA-binding IclR family transcriptional regulator